MFVLLLLHNGHVSQPGSACFFKLQQSTDYAIGGIATIT
jgi:hypothetical protein